LIASHGEPAEDCTHPFDPGDIEAHLVVTAPLSLDKVKVAPCVHVACARSAKVDDGRSEEHTSELQSPALISYAVFFLNRVNNVEIVVDLGCAEIQSRSLLDRKSVV